MHLLHDEGVIFVRLSGSRLPSGTGMQAAKPDTDACTCPARTDGRGRASQERNQRPLNLTVPAGPALLRTRTVGADRRPPRRRGAPAAASSGSAELTNGP